MLTLHPNRPPNVLIIVTGVMRWRQKREVAVWRAAVSDLPGKQQANEA